MLVISRKQGESFYVGNSLITITRVSGGRVRVGITVPRVVPIVRGELTARRQPDGAPELVDASGGRSR